MKNDIAINLIGGGDIIILYVLDVIPQIERFVYRYIAKKSNILDSLKNIRLLHVAPEKKLQKILKSFSHIEYISGDLNPLMNCDIRLDITDLNFKDNFFDVIICSHVLKHIVDERKAMYKLFRVLKPESSAILQVPISKNTKEAFEDFSIITPEGREKYFGQKDHVRIHGKNFKNRLKNVGFKVDLFDIKMF